MEKSIKYIEKFLIWGILIIMSSILVLAFIDIMYEIFIKISKPPYFIISVSGLLDLFSLFLILLIGIELLGTVKAYLKDDIVHVEFIILVAIIAIARKVIVWDFKKYSVEELVSLAIMMIALGVTYFLIRSSDIKLRFPARQRHSDEPEISDKPDEGRE
jgi:uncharacterized membrane protein (DUF373 family)